MRAREVYLEVVRRLDEGGSYFFAPETMKFFGAYHITHDARYLDDEHNRAVIVTTTRNDVYDWDREWEVRVVDFHNAQPDVRTIEGEFASLGAAREFARTVK